jgi:hypothetical protein
MSGIFQNENNSLENQFNQLAISSQMQKQPSAPSSNQPQSLPLAALSLGASRPDSLSEGMTRGRTRSCSLVKRDQRYSPYPLVVKTEQDDSSTPSSRHRSRAGSINNIFSSSNSSYNFSNISTYSSVFSDHNCTSSMIVPPSPFFSAASPQFSPPAFSLPHPMHLELETDNFSLANSNGLCYSLS